jgi:hypothetical protein
MAKTIEQKKLQEQIMVSDMIKVFCKKKHKDRDKNEEGLCTECKELQEYAKMRAQKCPFTKTKTFCSNCSVHCYKPDMREKIKEVMRCSGPHMLYVHPVAALRHCYYTLEKKRKNRKMQIE